MRANPLFVFHPEQDVWKEIEFGVRHINLTNFDIVIRSRYVYDTVFSAEDNISSLAVAINEWLHRYCFLFWLADMGMPWWMASWVTKRVPLWVIIQCENLYLDELWKDLGL